MDLRRGFLAVLVAALVVVEAGCSPSAGHGSVPTPAQGVIQPASVAAAPDVNGVSTDVLLSDTFQGTTYGGAADAFILQATISLDGTVLGTYPVQYLILEGNPGSGIYLGSATINVGTIPAGTHTLAVTLGSPPDFGGENLSSATITITAPVLSAAG